MSTEADRAFIRNAEGWRSDISALVADLSFLGKV